tara:strand:+ start:2964 stop:3392 length:429 start_codon:yes stop_codon:yes gene_type:complete
MRLPSYKRLYEVDFSEEDQEMIKILASSLNVDMENIYLALSKRISLVDNIQCTVKTVTVTVDSNGIPLDGASFQIDKEGGTQTVTKIIGIAVYNAVNQTNNSVFPTGAPFISFSQNEQTITINHIAGLPANNSFDLTVVSYN